MTKKLIIGSVLLCISSVYLFWFHTENACDIRDGHWASNGSYCITRDCYQTNSCGRWVSIINRCSNLKVGMAISEVYFQLGQPVSVEGNNYQWHSSKADSGKVQATIVNGTLQALDCNGI
jgi:hypothetical protein